MIELRLGDDVVEVEPDDGGRVGRISLDGFELLVTDRGIGPLGWGSFPMVPWAGRLGYGHFLVDDGRGGERPVTVPVDAPADEPVHAIHGTGHTSAWRVLDEARAHCELEVPLRWPLGGRAHQHVQLLPGRLVCVLSVVAGDEPMPAMVGWHPWFTVPEAADLRFAQMYARGADGLPDGSLVEPPPGPWDDCFTGPLAPPRLRYRHWDVTVESDCDHWVVFDRLDRGTCVEPQSGPPDAFNLGLAPVLRPGEMLQRTMIVGWRRRA